MTPSIKDNMERYFNGRRHVSREHPCKHTVGLLRQCRSRRCEVCTPHVQLDNLFHNFYTSTQWNISLRGRCSCREHAKCSRCLENIVGLTQVSVTLVSEPVPTSRDALTPLISYQYIVKFFFFFRLAVHASGRHLGPDRPNQMSNLKLL